MSVVDDLRRLRVLLVRERECVRALALEELQALAGEKEELLRALAAARAEDAEMRALAATVREENRRNAYLLWTSLNWVRDSVSFLGRQDAPGGYGAGGGTVHGIAAGRLLSGRV